MSRPPVSGEPPQPQVHDETCTHPEEQRRTQVIEEPTIYEVCSACEHVMAIRTDRASTGAALDAPTPEQHADFDRFLHPKGRAVPLSVDRLLTACARVGLELMPMQARAIAAEYARLAEQSDV